MRGKKSRLVRQNQKSKSSYSAGNPARGSMLNNIKWLTQRITQLIVWPLGLFLIPFTLAQIGQVVGIWVEIDKMWTREFYLIFTIWFMISRFVFALVWIPGTIWLVDQGVKFGFFWFKPERRNYESPTVDKSGTIIGIVVVFVMVIILAEFAIRLYTFTAPPYLPPPSTEPIL